MAQPNKITYGSSLLCVSEGIFITLARETMIDYRKVYLNGDYLW